MLADGIKAVVSPLLKVVWRPSVEGVGNVPRGGPLIVASNHLSFADSVIIPVCAPRHVRFLAKSDYFTGSGVRGTLTREWHKMIGSVPVERDDTGAAQAALAAALGVLTDGDAFGIYPEGTRSRDGRLYRGRTGVAWLALRSGAPVLPVGLIGTQELQPVGSDRPRLVHITVRFGAPRVYRPVDGVAAGRRRRDVTDEIMSAIQQLSGQELAGAYNELPGED